MKNLKKISGKLGPGIITGASDDDPSGILIYLQTGVIAGLSALWTALLTLPLMYTIQEMCARIGLVTGRGLISLIKEKYSRLILFVIALISVVVITINIGADLLAISVVAEHITDWPRYFWLPVAAAIVLGGTIFFSYKTFAKILKWLTFSLFFYVATVLYINVDWSEVLKATLWPMNFSWNASTIMLVTAIVGTTISPYLFFWQTEEEVEERSSKTKAKKSFVVTKHELKDLKEDTFLGMLFSNAVMWFIVVAAAQLANFHGLGLIENFDQAAMTLEPLLGKNAFLIFALGIVGTGMLAIPVLAGSIGYILAEVFNWKESLNLPYRQAPAFYGAIVIATVLGMMLSFVGLDPVKLLIYTGIFYTIITPPLIFIIIRLANDKKLMGKRVNSKISNLFAWLSLCLITALVIAYLCVI